MINETIGAVILAAGRGTRLGGAKMLLPIANKPMIAHVIDCARAAALATPIVVIPPEDADLRRVVSDARFTAIVSHDFARGIAHSLAAGIAAAPSHWRGAFILLGDMPFVAPELLHAMARHLTEKSITIPTYDGKRGNPTLWGRAHFKALMLLTGDVGGRALWAENARLIVEQPWHDSSIFDDIDTTDDWRTKSKRGRL